MTDSILVFDPGTRILDSGGNPVSGASLHFFDASTTDARTVYSNSTLATALGSVVYCDSSGAPVSAQGGTTKISIYTGTTAYKLIIKDGNNAIIETKDNIAGALDTSAFDDASVATASYPVVAESSDYTVVVADRGKVINVDPTSGDRTITLLSAVTAGDGFAFHIRHVGTANKVIPTTVSSQTISVPLPGGAATAFEMVNYGETLHLSSDGSNWHVIGQVLGLKLGSGYHVEVHNNGSISSGTETPDPEEGNFQQITNSGAFTLAPPAENTNIVILVRNNASAGTITTSGFTKVTGDAVTTSNGDEFLFNITVINGFSRLLVEALQ